MRPDIQQNTLKDKRLKLFITFLGENVLHMSVVAEDPTMVKYLLDQGINIHEECYGNFFCPEDQKPSRNDSLGPEHFLSFCRYGTRQRNRNFIHLQIFQPITAQLGNDEYRVVL